MSNIHASILEFLINNGYMESVEAFKREARQHLDLDSTPSDQQDLASQLAQLHIQRTNELLDGDNNYFNTLKSDFPEIHYTNILAIALEPQSQVLATSSIDKTVKISTMFNQDMTPRTYRHHKAPVLSIDFHPTLSHLMLTTSMDGSSVLVDTAYEPDFGEDLETSGIHQTFRDHQKYVIRGIFSPKQGKYIATASYDRAVCIYLSNNDDLPTYTLLKKLGPFIGNVETICFLDETTLVVGVRDDNYLHYVNLESMQTRKVNMNTLGDDWVSFSPVWISVSPDGKQLLCSTDHQSGRTILFEAGESRQIQNYYIHPTDNKFASKKHIWHPSGLYFYAIGGDDNSIAVVETKSGHTVASLTGHQAMIRSLAIHPELGLASAGYDHAVKLWYS